MPQTKCVNTAATTLFTMKVKAWTTTARPAANTVSNATSSSIARNATNVRFAPETSFARPAASAPSALTTTAIIANTAANASATSDSAPMRETTASIAARTYAKTAAPAHGLWRSDTAKRAIFAKSAGITARSVRSAWMRSASANQAVTIAVNAARPKAGSAISANAAPKP